ncbi:hypothetical protein PV327_006924 [Microctonus hyperodae]|uniref:Thiamine transporter 2 n=1 Tax=Microctonus hyperodae TaxID=165561 RepID=A0AA39F5G3_MICHY|nr:hypothetical protein PV327_006924 [Microctonus hyperodae]
MFGALKEFRPNEPFIYDYLTSDAKNFTNDEVIQNVYPIATYSNFATLIVVFLLTDFLRYKPMIILCGVSGIITYVVLILGTTISAMQVVEFFYGLYLSTEVAYYTYIYAKVDKEHYQAASSYVRSALLMGRFITGVIAQLLITFNFLNYHQLNYLTVLGQVLAVIWLFFLPSVSVSIYFHRPDSPIIDSDPVSNSFNQGTITSTGQLITHKFTTKKIKHAYYLLWQDFLKAYTNIDVLKWSLWWAAASCGYLQVLSYSQSIWNTCIEKDGKLYNGAVEALYTAIGALAVFGVGKLRLNWRLIGEIILSIFSFLEALFLFIVSRSYNIWLQYVIYIAFGVVYHTIVTVCSFEVAKRISDDSFGLIFGVNVFLALTFQSVLTFIVTSGNVLTLDIRTQFAVYSGYFIVLGIIFIMIAIYTVAKIRKSKEKLTLWVSREDNLNQN